MWLPGFTAGTANPSGSKAGLGAGDLVVGSGCGTAARSESPASVEGRNRKYRRSDSERWGAAMLDSAVYGTLNRYDSNMTGSEWQICKVAHIFYNRLYGLNLWCDEWTLEGSGGQFP